MKGFMTLIAMILEPFIVFFETDEQKQKIEDSTDEFLEKQAEARKLIDEKKRDDT